MSLCRKVFWRLLTPSPKAGNCSSNIARFVTASMPTGTESEARGSIRVLEI